MNNAAFDHNEELCCTICGGTNNHSYNPLLIIEADSDDYVEYVHLFCAQRDSRFGFCWCCGEEKVHLIENLNEANECSIHAGESVPDYPDDDLDSYIENIQKGD